MMVGGHVPPDGEPDVDRIVIGHVLAGRGNGGPALGVALAGGAAITVGPIQVCSGVGLLGDDLKEICSCDLGQALGHLAGGARCAEVRDE